MAAKSQIAGTRDGRTSMLAVQERMLRSSSARSRYIGVGGDRRVHVLEAGDGPPLLHLHGGSTSSLSHLTLLDRLPEVRSLAVDRPGHGLSDPAPVRTQHYRDWVIRFLDELLDAARLESVTLAGGSMGGVWALWYALARPGRVRGLALLGSAPLLPGSRPPAPLRVATTPLVGELLTRLTPPNRARVVRLMTSMGEGDTITRHPGLLDSLIAGGHDPIAAATNLAELRALISPLGFRPQMRIRPDELRRLAVPALLVWGDHDPVAPVEVAVTIARLISRARLEVLPAGHVPWLGHPDRVAELLSEFTRAGADG